MVVDHIVYSAFSARLCASVCLQSFHLWSFRPFLWLRGKNSLLLLELSARKCQFPHIATSYCGQFIWQHSCFAYTLHRNCLINFTDEQVIRGTHGYTHILTLYIPQWLPKSFFQPHHYVYLEYPDVWVGPVLCPISWVIHSVAGVICAGHLKLQTHHTLFTCSSITTVCSYMTSSHNIYHSWSVCLLLQLNFNLIDYALRACQKLMKQGYKIVSFVNK